MDGSEASPDTTIIIIYVAPNTEDFLGGHSVDKFTPDVDGIRVAVAQLCASAHGVGVHSIHQAV